MPEHPESGGLTVGEVSTRLGVTVRALHHWDEVGVATPSSRTPAGYRLYTARDLERLQRVLVYRELGLDLHRIRHVLDDSAEDVPAALRAQRAGVAGRIERLRQLETGLDRMIAAHEGGLPLSAEQQAAVFGPTWDPAWSVEARQRYGGTAQWREFAERAAGRSPEEWQEVAEAVRGLEQALGAAVDADVTPGSPAADALVDRHRELFGAYFSLTREMQVCLARMFEEDPGYAAHYDGIRPGLATWFREAVDASARRYGIDPATARWQ